MTRTKAMKFLNAMTLQETFLRQSHNLTPKGQFTTEFTDVFCKNSQENTCV